MKNWLGVIFAGLSIPAIAQTIGTLPGELSIDKGVAYYQIPLTLPAGKGGIAPDLALSYSSSGPVRSELGGGFSLSGLSAIKRCGDHQAIEGQVSSVTYSLTDNFCLNGTRLIGEKGVTGKDGSEYRLHVDNQSKIILNGDSNAASSYFIKHDKSGAVEEYHYNNLSKSWLLSSYKSNPSSASISYNYDNLGQISSIHYDSFSVIFNYLTINSGVPTKHYKIDGNIHRYESNLTRIDISINNKIKNYYRLGYKEVIEGLGASFIDSITYCDANDDCLPATQFDWKEHKIPMKDQIFFDEKIANIDLGHWGKNTIPSDWGNANRSWWVDIDGNSVGDFCKTDAHGFTCHMDVSQSSVARTYNISKWGDAHSHWWLDINGDSKTEFCRIDDGKLLCDAFHSNNTTTQLSWIVLNSGMKDFRWWRDMDGNGVPEYCRRIGDELLCSEPKEDGEWSDSVHVRGIEWGQIKDTYWTDINGDGGSELCFVEGQTIKCTSFSGKYLVQKNISFPISSVGQPDSRWWVDVNGDNAIDFCRMTDNDASKTVNLTCSLGSLGSLHKFEDDIEFVKSDDWTGELGSVDKRWWLDLDQDGVIDFCRGVGNKVQCVNAYKYQYEFDVDNWGTGFNSFIDLNQDGKFELCKKRSNRLECQTTAQSNHSPLLLEKVTNGLGHISSVWFGPYGNHTPSDSFNSDDSGLFNLPGSFPVAYRLETDNGHGKNNYLFQYGPAKRSKDGLKHNGFEWIRQRSFVNEKNTLNQEFQFNTEFPYSGTLKKQTDYFANGQKWLNSCGDCRSDDFWNFRELSKSSKSEFEFKTLKKEFSATKIVKSFQQLSSAADKHLKGYKLIEYKDQKYAASADKFVPVGGSTLMPIMIPATEFSLVEERTTVLEDQIPVWFMTPVSDDLNRELSALSAQARFVKAITATEYDGIVEWVETPTVGNTFAFYTSERKDYQYSESGELLSTVTVEQSDVDTFLNVGKITTTTTGLNPVTGYSDTFVEITQNAYVNKVDSWLIGLLDSTKTTYIHSDGSRISQEATFKYDHETGLLREHTTLPNTPYSMVTIKERDGYGIVTKESVTATNGGRLETRSTSFKHSYVGNSVVTEVTNPAGHVSSQTVDLFSGLIVKVDENGLSTSTKLDGFGREAEVSVVNTSVKSEISRFPAGDSRCLFNVNNASYCVINQSKSSGKKISFFDFLEREVRRASLSVNGKWVFVDSGYDAFGNLVSASKPYYQGDIPQYIVTQYDKLGRVISIKEPGPAGKEDSWISYSYGPFTVTKTDAKGRVSKTFTNVLGWEIEKQEPNGGKVIYDFYANGMLKSAIASEGETVRTEYNIQGNKSLVDDPDLGLWTYEYDGFGQLVNQTDAKGQSTHFAYDNLGRKVAEKVESKVKQSEKEVTHITTKAWFYDKVDGRVWLGGLLKATVDGELVKNYFYNGLGLLRREETITPEHTFARDLEYDSNGQLIREHRPNKFTLNYTRDALTGINTEVWGDISQAQVNYTAAEYRNVIEPLINEALNKAKDYLVKVKDLQEQQFFYKRRKEEYQKLKDQLISFDGVAENEAFARQMRAELHTRPLHIYTNEYGERYFKVSSRTVVVSGNGLIPVVQQPNFHLKIEGNLLREVSLDEWAAFEAGLINQNQTAYYGNYSDGGSISLATFDLERDDPLYDQRMRQMFDELNSLSKEVDRLEYVQDTTELRVNSYLLAAEQLVKLVKQVKLVSQKYNNLAVESESESDALRSLKDDNPAAGRISYWKLNDMDAEGRITSEVLGNGLVNSFDYHESNGQLLNIYTRQGSKLLRGVHYTYDRMDNVQSRRDLVNDIQENFYYDDQDRLTDYHLSGIGAAHAENPLFNKKYSMSYAANGNIKYKSDVGHYIYADPLHKHAVTQAGDNTYRYDENGNMLSGGGRTIEWTGFNKPSRIQQEQGWVDFKYDESNQRVSKRSSDGSRTWYLGKSYELKELASGDIQQTQYIYAGNGLVAVNVNSLKTDGQGSYASVDRQIRYSHTDALKSVDMVSDMWGNIVDRKLYDPWGKERAFTWKADNVLLPQPVLLNRAFTGHEMLNEVDLIHMNGRLYDATLARFISADVYIQAPDNSQSFNRYSYVLNNPLKYNDPSGHFFKRIKKELKRQWNDVREFTSRYSREIVGIVVGIVVTVASGGTYSVLLADAGASFFSAGSLTNAIAAGALGGATGGAVTGGIISESWNGVGKGAAIGAITGAIGGYNSFKPTRGFAHAATKVSVAAAGGCATGEIAGGSCEKGAKFAALSQVVVLSFEYMKNVTDRYKIRSCEVANSGSVCKYNVDGELLTDGTRGSTPVWEKKPIRTEWFTEAGMASEASGNHRYLENGLIGRFVNKVSKVHDYFNSDVSRLFGFHGYDQVTGLWIEAGTIHNHLFQVYSFSGMLPAAIYTGGALVAPYPVYPYSQLGD
ncbi:type IV secretion protein Rhs [Vibrio alginolyticus]|nr:type IV secretion protein Rhs [Vibrio alginolyticus]